MSDNVTVEIVAIGTEILLGTITDTNSVFLAQTLRDIGTNVYYMTTVGDNASRIESALRIAMNRAQVVITCGGLGPTVDDMTRQAVAQATDRELVYHEELYEQIAARFASFRVRMSENNKRQAYLPANALVIENPVGTAPGFMVEHNGNLLISLPGVPRELKYLMIEQIVPYLKQRFELGVIRYRILKTAGIGESLLDELLGDELLNAHNPSIGLAAHHGVIDIRITGKAEDDAEAQAMLDEMAKRVHEKAGEFIFGEGDARLEDVVGQALLDTNRKIGIVEAGISTKLIENLNPDVIRLVREVAHPQDIEADVDSGVNRESLRDMAITYAYQLGQQTGLDGIIVILGLPDMDENADDNTGTAVAVWTEHEQRSRAYGFGARSQIAAEWVGRWALASLWQMLRSAQHDVE